MKPLLDYGFLFNAGTEREEAHGLNWDMTAFRPLDNALGRFFGIDLLSEDYVSFSPMHFGLNNPISLNDPLGLNANDFDDGSGRKEVDAGATGKKNQRGGEVFDTVDELVGYLYSLAGDGETHFTFKGEGANLRIIRISFLSGGSTNKNQETGIWQVPGFSFSSFDVQVRGTAQKAVQSNEAFAFYSHLNNSNQQWYNGVVSPLMDAVTAVVPIGGAARLGNWLGKGLTSSTVNGVFYHSTRAAGHADFILNGINIKKVSKYSRFGRGFYLGSKPITTIAELHHHGFRRVQTLQYDLVGAKLLNASNLGAKYTPKLLRHYTKLRGYDGILFNSLRYSNGQNAVLFKNFTKLQNGKITY